MESLVFRSFNEGCGILDREVPAALDRLQVAISNAKADAGSRVGGEDLAEARLEAARAFRQLSWSRLTYTMAVRALALVRELRKAGAYDELFAPEVTGEFSDTDHNLPGLLAMMLVSPAWRWGSAPLFSAVPNWMWGAYAEWLFAAPHRPLLSSESDQCAAHLSRHAAELARWVECNLGSATIRLAAETFIKDVSLAPLAPMNPELRPLAQTRAHILMRIFDHQESPGALAVNPGGSLPTHWRSAPRSRRLERNHNNRRASRADEGRLISAPHDSCFS